MTPDTVTTELLGHKPEAANKKDLTLKPATKTNTLPPELVARMNAYWRAANYLAVGQIYLYDNPLLKEPLKLSHVKPLVVGHWGTVPGQNFIYVHLNRVIKKYDLNMFYIAGPGHGGAALVGNVYLEGTWSEVYPNVTQDEAGMKELFKQFSFPGGISSHVAPTKRKPPPWRPRGNPTNFSIPSLTEPCCLSCTSTATRSAIQPFWLASSMKSWNNFCKAAAGRPTSWKAMTRKQCTNSWLPL
jgi:hypothetical protein